MPRASQKTPSILRENIQIDASDKILGRLAVEVACLLRGKDLPSFAPNLLPHRKITLINVDKMRISEKKQKQKEYWRHSGYPGGIKRKTLEELFAVHPEKVFSLAISRMLPNNKLRKIMMRNLEIVR
ncbi:MAG: 50S ribosomal protein L13 [Candidatus Colwellbacteria bacterium]|nr:50S ribosomal protein L13 [Candidatus Colwellbacteria bacterium]